MKESISHLEKGNNTRGGGERGVLKKVVRRVKRNQLGSLAFESFEY